MAVRVWAWVVTVFFMCGGLIAGGPAEPQAWGTDFEVSRMMAERYGQPLVVLFVQENCRACIATEEAIDTAEAKNALGHAVRVKLEYSENLEIARKFGIKSTPTMLVFDPLNLEEEVYRESAVLTVDRLQMLEPALKSLSVESNFPAASAFAQGAAFDALKTTRATDSPDPDRVSCYGFEIKARVILTLADCVDKFRSGVYAQTQTTIGGNAHYPMYKVVYSSDGKLALISFFTEFNRFDYSYFYAIDNDPRELAAGNAAWTVYSMAPPVRISRVEGNLIYVKSAYPGVGFCAGPLSGTLAGSLPSVPDETTARQIFAFHLASTACYGADEETTFLNIMPYKEWAESTAAGMSAEVEEVAFNDNSFIMPAMDFRVSQYGSKSLTLSWFDMLHFRRTNYVLAWQQGSVPPADCSGPNSISFAKAAAVHSHKVVDLQPDTDYAFTLCSVDDSNINGSYNVKLVTRTRPPMSVPGPPANFALETPYKKWINAMWDPEERLSYYVNIQQGRNEDQECVRGIKFPVFSLYRVTASFQHLLYDTEYTVTVCAVNEDDEMGPPARGFATTDKKLRTDADYIEGSLKKVTAKAAQLELLRLNPQAPAHTGTIVLCDPANQCQTREILFKKKKVKAKAKFKILPDTEYVAYWTDVEGFNFEMSFKSPAGKVKKSKKK